MTDQPESGGDGKYKVRAGALTLSYLNSTMGWDALRTILAQSATGADLIDTDALVVPDTETTIAETFADRYLVEPADPGDDPDDDETPMRPTPAGREVPFVGATLQRWLERCPGRPVTPGVDSGDVLWPLLSGWVATVVHAVAVKPRSAAEIQEAVGVLPLEMTEAKIDLLNEVGLVDALPPERPGGEERFEPTDWLRLAVAPLAAAARMELRHPHPRGDTAPIAAADVEAAFLLTLPLLELPAEMSGSCSLAVDLDAGVIGSPAGVTARIEGGRVADCDVGLDEDADVWTAASASAWLDAVIELDTRQIHSEGQHRVATALLRALHERLFG
jgi:hypothetical protein